MFEEKRVEKTEAQIVEDIIDKLRMETYVPCYLTLKEREVALKWMETAKILIWQVNELCNRLDQRLRIMMGRDDKRVWYEIDLDGGEEDEDED